MKRMTIKITGIVLAMIMMICLIPAMGQTAYESEEEQTDIVEAMEETVPEEPIQTDADEVAVEEEAKIIMPEEAEVSAPVETNVSELEETDVEEAETIEEEDKVILVEDQAEKEAEVITPAETDAQETEDETPDDGMAAEEIEVPVLADANDAEENEAILTAESEDAEPEITETEEEPNALLTSIVDSGKCGDNVTWELDDAGVLTISGTGDMYNENVPWYSVRHTIKKIVISDGITSIGDYAFNNCEQVSDISISDSVTNIGENAFANCSNLTSVTIPDGVTRIDMSTFENCSSLTSVMISKGVTRIDLCAFKNCSSLTSIIIPEGVTSIDLYVFANCSSLTSISIPVSLRGIDDSAFLGCSALSEVYYSGTIAQWLEIGISSDNEPLLRAVIHCSDGDINNGGVEKGIIASDSCGADLIWELDSEGILTISGTGDMDNYHYQEAPWYSYRTIITNIVIMDNVTSIGDYAFEDCDYLTSVTIPNGIVKIGDCAFDDCSNLISVSLSDSVTDIGAYAFAYCDKLTDITSPSNLESIGYSAFMYCSFADFLLPDSITNIGEWAFTHCNNLTSISIPDGITCIGEWTFNDCSSLTAITIPKSVTIIGWMAFDECSSLSDVYYTGNEAEWNEIAFETGNDFLLNATLHYEEEIEPEIVASGTCGTNVTWTLDDKGTITIAGIGIIDDCNDHDQWGLNPLTPWYDYTRSIKKVTINEGVTSIGNCAFYGCEFLTDVSIPDGVTRIGRYAFTRGIMNEITIPASVTVIGEYAFAYCRNLTDVYYTGSKEEWSSISFNSGNTILTTAVIHCSDGDINGGEDDIIGSGTFEKDFTWTLTHGGMLTISGMGDMDEFSLFGVPWQDYEVRITNVVINNGVTSISPYAFISHRNLISITIPEGVTSIGERAFDGCEELTDVYFNGSRSEWKKITILDGNTFLQNAKIHYAEEGISVTSITLDKMEETMLSSSAAAASTLQLVGTIEPADAANRNILWSSSDEKVVTVDENGVVTARTYGTAIITATAEDDTNGEISASCTIHVLFYDVTGGYYYKPVYWAADLGITKGYSSGEYVGAFGVGKNCTRQDLMIFMWRYAGKPAVSQDARTLFNDVTKGANTDANKAIAWGYTTGIAKGYSDGGFHPNDPITRREVMIMLYRLANKPAVSGTMTFTDVIAKGYKTTSDSYKAILWGVNLGITKGYSDGTFGVDEDCLREQIVTFLYRYGH